MRDSNADRAREILFEAFLAGWQAGLALKVTDPRARTVVQGCFDLWLKEALDEAEVMGLLFRRRHDLPPPAGRPLLTSSGLLRQGEELGPDGRPAPTIPAQRSRRSSVAGKRKRSSSHRS